ncbi:MAG: helix-turn-helix domain-containing protein [Spirochaetaceae bacterium]|jgi:transcriptional regulator with XRE-family HTH domain|nr:helix-turn-helix domain-containing protein [Spirochaetaceae bacterium]
MGFKENLKAELDFSGLVIKELAVRSGVNKRTIENYFSTHNCLPSVDAAVKIARVLGVSVEYLVTGEETAVSAHAAARPRFTVSPEMLLFVRAIEELTPEKRAILTGIIEVLKKGHLA